MKEIVPKMECRRAQMWDNLEGGELDPVDDICRCCKWLVIIKEIR